MMHQIQLIQKAQEGDLEAKRLLVEENTGLIWSVARRFIGRGVETEDLFQLGCLGFLKAMEGFDLAYGTQFSTYAVPKIAGEIRRFIRDDGAVKVSRTLKEKAFTLNTSRQALIHSLGREPTVSELSIKTGFTPEEIAEADAATASVESIHQQTGEDGFCLENVLTDSKSEAQLLEQISLHQAVDALEDKVRTVIKLRYFHGLTQEQVSRILKVSQVQVSRIEKKALIILRARMSE